MSDTAEKLSKALVSRGLWEEVDRDCGEVEATVQRFRVGEEWQEVYVDFPDYPPVIDTGCPATAGILWAMIHEMFPEHHGLYPHGDLRFEGGVQVRCWWSYTPADPPGEAVTADAWGELAALVLLAHFGHETASTDAEPIDGLYRFTDGDTTWASDTAWGLVDALAADGISAHVDGDTIHVSSDIWCAGGPGRPYTITPANEES